MTNLKQLAVRILYRISYSQWFKTINVLQFHRFFYNSKAWQNTTWLGTNVWKNPLDLWIYQEIIFEVKPDLIIETGTAYGGSALYMASKLDLVNNGRIVTVDINDIKGRPQHPRIRYLLGSSTSKEIVGEIKNLVHKDDKVMVVLDSDHRKEHTINELRIYSELVSKGSYIIVEDSNINGHPVCDRFGPGPLEAVEEFLAENQNFVSDMSKEKYHVTFNPKGYLRKIR